FGWGRAVLGSIAAIGLFLYGAASPFTGRLADRWSARYVIGIGCIVLGLSTIAASFAHTLFAMIATVGVVSALAAGAVGMPSATSLVARWFKSGRGLVIGVLGAGMSAGQILVIPLTMVLVLRIGWRGALLALGLIALAFLAPLAFGVIRDGPHESQEEKSTRLAAVEGLTVRAALREPAFWLLAGSFFVCGYTSNGLILTFFIDDCVGRGFPGIEAANALALMGGLNVVGTIASGWICDRFGRRIPLACFYFFRGLTLIWLIFVREPVGLFAFAAAFGLNYIATVPPTNSLVSRIFGARSAGEIYGWVFVSHQLGSALGAMMGGITYSYQHSYAFAYASAAALAVVAAIAVLTIRDVPRFVGRDEDGRLKLEPAPA
ncbi:MAG: MFS transporter, partial [Candidatus Eremiobacteraeota bacterium]|nr:MFS transporter [Candidatus Eremiobacteraeota bacterium]